MVERLTDMPSRRTFTPSCPTPTFLGVRHHGDWVRSAIVTDIEWMARATKLFAWMIPGEARVYPVAELDQAKAWVAG